MPLAPVPIAQEQPLMKPSEVAEALGCSVRTAKYRMKAALATVGREAERMGVRV